MSTRRPQPEAHGLSQSQASSRVLSVLPMIAFPLVILFSMLTAASAIVWLVEGFVRGGDGVHLEEQLPRVAQLTDVRGVGQFERLSSSKWATVSHIAPGTIWLFLWPFQFTTSLRWKLPRVHRWVGTFLLVEAAVILLAVIPMCTTGACYNHKQRRPWPLVLEGFWTPPFGPHLWLYGAISLWRSYVAARRHQYTLHRRWMIRLNAIFLGVTLTRPVVLVTTIALDSHPRADDLDFRWKVFWDCIWISMVVYLFVAEVWLAIESRFGLGKVSVRPPIASKRT